MSSKPSRKARLLAIVLAPFLLLAACGKKGDPQPPLRTSPQTTTKLAVSQRGTDLLMELPYPTTTSAGQALEGIERVEIYAATVPVPESSLDLLRPEEEAAGDAPVEVPADDDAERTEADEPREPGSTDFYGEAGIVAADEVDQREAEREVADEMAEAAAATEDDAEVDAGEAGEAEAPAEDFTPPTRASRLRQLLEPLDPRQFESGAELVATVAGDDLTSAVSGGEVTLRLPLSEAVLEEPRIHYLGVRTVGPSGEPSELSNQAVIVPRTPPPSPRGLDAAPRADGIHVEWQPQGEVVGYNLYRRNVRNRLFDVPVAVPTPDRVSYLDRTARFGETYVYAVTAVAQRNPLLESAVTQVREVDYRDTFPPPPPENLVALAEEGRVRVVWEGSDADDLAGYRVLRRVGPPPAADAADEETTGAAFEALTDEPLTGTEYVDRDVTAGQTYTYRVEAVDATGNSSDGALAATEAR